MFELKDVNLVYDLGKKEVTHALRNISYKSGNTGLIGLIGPSGSGKSSMLYIMAGLKNPTSGEVYYKENSINNMSIDNKAGLRRREFGFIFQRGFLIEYMTVLNNVLVPLNDASIDSKTKALELLSRLGIEKLANQKPYQLSGGQRQRVAIARALISNPEVVFADEPTAALDHKSAMEVMSILSDYARTKLVIVVTHDTSIFSGNVKMLSIWDGVLTDTEADRKLTGVEGQVG
jgi:putative ABC transport system ATP-binding protein